MLYLPGEFPQDAKLTYLNHAAIGPWPKRTAQAVAQFAYQNLSRGGADYPEWLSVERRLRERIARLLNAPSADDIALTKNTSDGLSTIAFGMDWRPGDEILGVAHDFISNRMVWEALADRGVTYRNVDAFGAESPADAIIQAMTPGTRLVALSSVNYAVGHRLDLVRISEACRQAGSLLSVDVIQSLGAVPFDLQQIDADFVAGGGHKWLLTPEGIGFLYCRPALRDRLALRQFGWAMRASPYDFEAESWSPAQSARRFESGTPNMIGIHGMEASLSLFEEIGIDEISARLATNMAILSNGLSAMPDIDLLTPTQPDQRAGILTFRSRSIPGEQLHRQLMATGIICSPRAGGVRWSPHFYTPRERLESALEQVARLVE